MSTKVRALLSKFADVQPKGVQWLWPQRVPVGKLTLLAGDPGLGKSFITLDMAARVSRNGDWPDAQSPYRLPGDTLILSAEDDPSDTIRPRLDALGADTSRVHFIHTVAFQNGNTSPWLRLDRDIEAVRDALGQMQRPRLVVIDPISAYMGEVDANSNAEVRGVLAKLAEIAQKAGVAILAVTHLNKGQQTRTLYRAMGSLAFTAAARCVYAVSKDPHDDRRCIVLPVKANLNVRKGGMAYTITDGKLQWTEMDVTTTIEEIDTPSEIVDGDSLQEAQQWLASVLENGPVDAVQLRDMAAQVGMPWITVRRAKKRVGVDSRVVARHGKERHWVWELSKRKGGAAA